MNNIKKIVELVILLNGNFVVALVDENTKSNIETLIINIIKDSENDPFKYLKLGDITIFGKYIVGWYFRPITKNPSDKIIEFMDKKMPDSNEGDEWKGQS